MENKRRVIIDYSKLTDDMLRYLVEKYPDGYDDRDLITFKNAKNESIEAIQITTDDSIYLVKISVKLVESMENYELDEEELETDQEIEGFE